MTTRLEKKRQETLQKKQKADLGGKKSEFFAHKIKKKKNTMHESDSESQSGESTGLGGSYTHVQKENAQTDEHSNSKSHKSDTNSERRDDDSQNQNNGNFSQSQGRTDDRNRSEIPQIIEQTTQFHISNASDDSTLEEGSISSKRNSVEAFLESPRRASYGSSGSSQRARVEDVPYDRSIATTTLWTSKKEIDIHKLMDENIEFSEKLTKTFLTLQLLRITTPSNGNNGLIYNNIKGGTSESIQYHRMYLCRQGKTLCYIITSDRENTKLLNGVSNERDNGTFTIGSWFRFNAPHPIEKKVGEIPCLSTFRAITIIEKRTPDFKLTINFGITENKHTLALLECVEISIRRTDPLDTNCTGFHCDKANPTEHMNVKNKGCGCYHGTGIGSCKVALQHLIQIMIGNATRNYVKGTFSSTQFNRLFLTEKLPYSVAIKDVEDKMDEIDDKITECIDEIKLFNIVVYYLKGEVKDETLVVNDGRKREQKKTQNSQISYHICYIEPYDKDYMKRGTQSYMRLHQKKFNVREAFGNISV